MEEQRKVRVTLPGGVIKEGIEIGVIDSNERWNEVVLADGTTLRIKLALTQVIRIPDEWDPEGNPIYITKTTNLMVVNAPDSLRKM